MIYILYVKALLLILSTIWQCCNIWSSINLTSEQAIAMNLFYIYIYSRPQAYCFVVSQLFSVARHARFSKLGSKLDRLLRQLKILPHSHEETNISEGILNAHVAQFVLFIHWTATESLIPSKSLATITSFAR